MIDLHAHVLPGLDDGPATLAESLEILAAAAAEGVTRLAATPHVSARYPTSAGAMEATLAGLRRGVQTAGIPVEVLPGAEIAHERLAHLDDDELARCTLGGSPTYVLVEFPYDGWPPDLVFQLQSLGARGFRPVLAHPERNDEVQRLPDRLEPIVESGALVQITAAAVDGRIGERAQRTAHALLERRLAHLLASDAHGLAVRRFGLRGACDHLGDPALARWLTQDVPAAILDGRDPPETPARRGRSRRLGRLAMRQLAKTRHRST